MRFLALLSKFKLGMNDLDLLVIDNVGDLDKDYAQIERDVQAFGDVDLVIVDTSAAVFRGEDENSNAQMRAHASPQQSACLRRALVPASRARQRVS
jgi:AAA domain